MLLYSGVEWQTTYNVGWGGEGHLLTGTDDDGLCCVDVNECESQRGVCEQVCRNTWGSFYCACHDGYQLQPDAISCTGVVDVHQSLVYCYLPVTCGCPARSSQQSSLPYHFLFSRFLKRSQFWHRPCRLVTYSVEVPHSDRSVSS